MKISLKMSAQFFVVIFWGQLSLPSIGSLQIEKWNLFGDRQRWSHHLEEYRFNDIRTWKTNSAATEIFIDVSIDLGRQFFFFF